MKKIFTLLIFMLITSGLFAQSPRYWDGTDWRDDADGGGSIISNGGPSSSTGFIEFVIEANGYEVSGTDDKAQIVRVRDGGLDNLYFTVSGKFSVSQLITDNESGQSGVACYIKNGGQLILSDIVPSEIPRRIAYEGSTSILSLFEVTTSLSTVYPGNNGGHLKLNKSEYIYDFGAENIIIDDSRSISLSSGITFKAGTLTFNKDIDLLAAAQGSEFIMIGNTKLSSGFTLNISTTGLSFKSGGRFIVEPGAKIVTDDNSGSIDKLTLEGSSTAQGIIVGTGFTCSDVTMSVVPNWSRGDGTYGNYAWRELGTPFDKSVYGGDVAWGGDNEANINGNDGADVDPGNGGGSNSFINYWNAGSQQWEVPSSSGTGSGTGPYTSTVNFNNAFEVWYEGNATNTITVTNGNLATSHNMNYDVTVSTDQWKFIPNPYASYLAIKASGVLNAAKGGIASVLTDEGGGYSYKTVKSFGTGTLGKSSIPPFQAFWIQGIGDGTVTIQPNSSTQVDDSDGSSLSKMNEDYIPSFVDLVLINSDDYTQEVVCLCFIDDVVAHPLESYNAINMNSLGNVATMQIPSSNGSLISIGHDISAIEGATFTSDLEMIGKIDGTYKISIAGKTIAAELNVYLIDKQQGITHLLNDSDYSFSHSSTNDANRFNVFITSTTLGEAEKLEAKSIKLANKGNTVEFYMPSTSAIANVQFVSVSGQLVKNVQASNGQTEFDVSDFTKGVYIAKLRLESGNEVSFKFVR